MRKNVLALSVAAMIGGLGLAGGAHAAVITGTDAGAPAATGQSAVAGQVTQAGATALQFASSGIGHILLVPYFTTQNGNATLLNIVNTDTLNGKAVKIRFRGASNSDDIFDFQVYLSPGDVWTANVSAAEDGRSRLATSDNSCTIPASVNASFVTDRLPSTMTADEKAAQTREGYIEIFNMADIPAVLGADATKVDSLYEAIKHTSAGTVDCGTQLTTNVATDLASEADARTRGFNTPTTGLMANWTIINLAEAASYSGNASAIAATGGNGRGNIVFFPQTAGAVGGTGIDTYTADPSLRTVGVTSTAGYTGTFPAIAAANFDLPDLSTPYLAASVGAPAVQAANLTASISKTALINEYLTDDAIQASTDWVFSMPTRRYSVALDYRAGATINNFRLFNAAVVDGAAATWFNAANTTVVAGQICTILANGAVKQYDRSERTPASTTDFVISPGTPAAPLSFCGEASVLSFNAGGAAGASVLGAAIARKDIEGPYADGWANINTVSPGGSLTGLPVLGQAFMKATNDMAADGVNGNFGISFDHRFR